MTTATAAVAVAAVRDSVRRPAFLVTVLGALLLGYLAVPPASAGYAMVKVGSFRGIYDSGYIGMMFAMIGSLWLPLFGFFAVRNTLARDRSSGVGELLAATPLRTPAYLLGKYFSNLAVLAAMAGALAVIAPVMQFVRDESTSLDVVALWLPLVLLCLPLLAVAAGAAVLFESIPFLRNGFGNIVWFFAYPAAFLVMLPLLFSDTTAGFQADVAAQYPGANYEVSIGLTAEESGLGRFVWSGPDFGPSIALVGLIIMLVSMLTATVPALWSSLFESVRQGDLTPAPTDARVPEGGAPTTASGDAFARSVRTPTLPNRGNPFWRMVVGELRIQLGGLSRWWWLGMAALTGVGLVVPGSATGFVLLGAWLWPVLLWSKIGTHAVESGAEPLMVSGTSFRRRLGAEWCAGALVAAMAGAGPLVHMLLTADVRGVVTWLAAVSFVPSLALLLGSLGRSARLFQAVYLVLWYAVLNGVTAVDFIGVHRGSGTIAGPSPLGVLAVSAVLTAAALLVQETRHAHR